MGGAGDISATEALEAQSSANDLELAVQPKSLEDEEGREKSYTESGGHYKGHSLDANVTPIEALKAQSSASDVKLVTEPKLQVDETD